MKIISVIVLSSAALALAGCGKQGGASDPYNTDSGAASYTNYNRGRITNDYQGNANDPGSINIGARASTNNYGVLTNDQGGANSPSGRARGAESVEPISTNDAPKY